MVMPQMVLYEQAFYDQHKKEIDDAAEAWGYALADCEIVVDVPGLPKLGSVQMVAFARTK